MACIVLSLAVALWNYVRRSKINLNYDIRLNFESPREKCLIAKGLSSPALLSRPTSGS